MKFRLELLIIFIGCGLGFAVCLFVMNSWYPASSNKPNIQYGDFSSINQKFNHKYVLFTSSTCEFCTKEKAYLKKIGINFREIALDKNKQAANYFSKQLKENEVPALYSEDRKLIGYNKDSIDDFLVID